MKAIGKSWRDSATLIVVARRAAKVQQSDVNYDILLQTRTRSASFPNSVVFPGGVSEPTDVNDKWLTHFNAFGYSQQDFESFHSPGTITTPLFQSNPIQRHISLRITAIRETFEELGLLLCSRQHKKDREADCASIISDIDIKHWQKRVHKQPTELLSLCKEYNCYPDIWSLYYWSNWLSPVNLPKRFSTAFFITALANKPTGVKSNSEVTNVEWINPLDISRNNHNFVVYAPQFYELHRITTIKDIEELTKFAKERSCHGEHLLFPYLVKTNDGRLHLLPGDDLFPSNVDYCDTTVKTTHKTVEELRQGCNKIHRLESKPPHLQFVFKNYKSKNHINMGDSVIPAKITIH